MFLRLRTFFNQTLTTGPALFRRLRIAFSNIDPAQKGLIIIQIDGLSANRLQRALKRRHMPFVKRLLRKRRSRLYRYLSEIPTSTPAFQGGMFYGDNENIPGFNFYDKREQRIYRMGDSECAYNVESKFTNPGLLRHGSVFSCVYSGGAEASLFVFSSLLAPKRWRFALRVYDLIVLTLIHATVVAKIIALALIELVAGSWDFIKRVRNKGGVVRELEIIAIRIGLSVISRELITLGAVIDIFRRVPVVYINYLGYDEYAHLRGPNSRFAMWSLRSIDRSIRRIHRASRYAERSYDVYILSDHGQSACKPFSLAAGQSIVELLQSALANMAVKHETHLDEKTSQLLLSWQGTTRLAQNLPWYLRGPVNKYSKYLERKFREAAQKSREWEDLFDLTVVSTGPIAYAYWTNSADKVTVETIEQEHPGLLDRLASHSSVGIVTAVRDDGLVLAKSGSHHALISETGIISQSGTMPYDRARNRDHAVRGLWRITRFARSGDICIWGGYAPSGDISYSYEMGCHSGWTDEETEAFVIAPKGTDFDFSQIVRHKEFYEFFSKRYGPWCVQGKNLAPMDPRAVTEAAHVTLSAANSD